MSLQLGNLSVCTWKEKDVRSLGTTSIIHWNKLDLTNENDLSSVYEYCCFFYSGRYNGSGWKYYLRPDANSFCWKQAREIANNFKLGCLLDPNILLCEWPTSSFWGTAYIDGLLRSQIFHNLILIEVGYPKKKTYARPCWWAPDSSRDLSLLY